jgi:hypothetical protein
VRRNLYRSIGLGKNYQIRTDERPLAPWSVRLIARRHDLPLNLAAVVAVEALRLGKRGR